MNRPRLTPATCDAIIKAALGGTPPGRIAHEFGVDSGRVRVLLDRRRTAGVDIPKYHRGLGVQNPAIRTAIDLASRGVRPVEIAREIGRDRQAVCVMLSRARARGVDIPLFSPGRAHVTPAATGEAMSQAPA